MTQRADTLARARDRDTAARRARVLQALDQMKNSDTHVSISSVARLARVHRSFIHRHPELHTAVTSAASEVGTIQSGATVSTASLLADVANLHGQNTRLARHITRLERRLSEAFGLQAYQDSGLGAPDNTADLHQQVATLTERVLELTAQLTDRDDDLVAVRAANRELIATMNRTHTR